MNENQEIPSGWTLVKLGELVVDPKKDLVDGPFGSNLKADEYTDSGVPVFKIQNIKANLFLDKNINYITEEKAKSLSRHSFISGDLIITKLGYPLGLCCKVPEKYRYGIIVADLMRLRPNALFVNDQFLIYAINCNVVQNQFKAITKGTTRPRVNLTIVREIELALPPLSEQYRIVAKIEELFSSLDKGIESLKTAQQQLKVYQQAVLKWAFEGKLTNKDVKEGELPEGWKKVELGTVIEQPKYGTSRKCDYNIRGKGVLRIPNVSNGIIDDSDLKYAEFTNEEIETFKLKEGDILTIRSNGSVDLVGKCSRITVRDEDYLFAGYLIRLRPLREEILSKYLFYVLSSSELRIQIEAKSKSTSGVNNINSNEFKSLIIPLCLFSEQHAIVAEIESRLSVCDKIEESIEQSLKQAESLRQSILKKAFAGKLVPQDPNDEPASKLLERINAERKENKPENPQQRFAGKTKTKKGKS